MADNSARIAEIQAILRNGAAVVKTEGLETTYDFDTLRSELRQLIADDDELGGTRPTVFSINLGGSC